MHSFGAATKRLHAGAWITSECTHWHREKTFAACLSNAWALGADLLQRVKASAGCHLTCSHVLWNKEKVSLLKTTQSICCTWTSSFLHNIAESFLFIKKKTKQAYHLHKQIPKQHIIMLRLLAGIVNGQLSSWNKDIRWSFNSTLDIQK